MRHKRIRRLTRTTGPITGSLSELQPLQIQELSQQPEAGPVFDSLLPQVANNSRFLILPRVPELASHILGRVARRIAADWLGRYGHRVVLWEMFVERGRFRGSCYRAANWIGVGQTQGRTRQDRRHVLRAPVKDVWVCSLRADFRKALCQ